MFYLFTYFMVAKQFPFSKQASSLEKVFEESPLALCLSLAHTIQQFSPHSWPGCAKILSSSSTSSCKCPEGWQCSQRSTSVPFCPTSYQSCSSLLEQCWHPVLGPELLQELPTALGLGNLLSGTLESAASKASSDGHVLLI